MCSDYRKITFRKFAVFAMIVSLIVTVTGILPDFVPVDANRYLAVNLNDLILHTQRMADTAYHPESFTASFDRVIRSFRLVSGIDHRISKEKPQGFFKYSSLNMLFVSNAVSFHELDDGLVLQLPVFDYSSIISAPPDPPPEMT